MFLRARGEAPALSWEIPAAAAAAVLHSGRWQLRARRERAAAAGPQLWGRGLKPRPGSKTRVLLLFFSFLSW